MEAEIFQNIWLMLPRYFSYVLEAYKFDIRSIRTNLRSMFVFPSFLDIIGTYCISPQPLYSLVSLSCAVVCPQLGPACHCVMKSLFRFRVWDGMVGLLFWWFDSRFASSRVPHVGRVSCFSWLDILPVFWSPRFSLFSGTSISLLWDLVVLCMIFWWLARWICASLTKFLSCFVHLLCFGSGFGGSSPSSTCAAAGLGAFCMLFISFIFSSSTCLGGFIYVSLRGVAAAVCDTFSSVVLGNDDLGVVVEICVVEIGRASCRERV